MLHSQERLELAHAGPFTLGSLHLEPELRLARNGETTCIVEPRVMQLLVALHRASGRILSRDDLIQLCWGGSVVGDNAIQRAVSQARKIAATIGNNSFEVETIRGVGYRLVTASGAEQGAGERPMRDSGLAGLLSRRAAVGALVTVGAGAAAAALFGFGAPQAETIELAQGLYSRGEVARQDGGEGQLEKAASLFGEAVREYPEHSKAWGALAATYILMLQTGPNPDFDRLASLARSAADRSLSLDRRNADALAARILVKPFFGNWQSLAPQLQMLAREHPREWFVQMELGDLAANLGRMDLAERQYRKALAIEPLLAQVHSRLAVSLWADDRLHEAEEAFEEASRRWRRDWFLWNSRFLLLVSSGDLDRAERWISDPSVRPRNLTTDAVSNRLRVIQALQDGEGELRSQVVADYVRQASEHPLNIRNSSMVLAALDARDEIFELLDGYFLGRGRFPTKIGPYSQRATWFLFLPPFRPLHSDGRFHDLLRAIRFPAPAIAS